MRERPEVDAARAVDAQRESGDRREEAHRHDAEDSPADLLRDH
jgi:hypothetical protein